MRFQCCCLWPINSSKQKATFDKIKHHLGRLLTTSSRLRAPSSISK